MAKPKFRSTSDVIIRTKKLAKATKFYQSVFGLQVTHKSKNMKGFQTGAFCLYVEKGKKHGPVFEYLVPDVKAAKKRLIAAGCKIVEEDPELPRCYMRDPYGIVFNVGPA